MGASVSRFKTLALTAVVAYGWGALLGGLLLLWNAIVQRPLPNWPWWYFAIAPAVIGFGALLLELAVGPLVERDRVSDPAVRRAVRFAVLLMVGVAMLLLVMLISD